MTTTADTGQIAVRAANHVIRLHLLRDPGDRKVPPGAAFTDDHPTVCGRYTFGRAMPETTSTGGLPVCGVCERNAR